MNNIDYLIDNEPSVSERQALNKAVSALYFADNSDYVTALWGVVDAKVGLPEGEEEETLYYLFKKLHN